MSVNPLPSQPSSPLGRNRSSLFSKFRSQLGQRNRGITDYYIEPDDPWRSYFPGDVISGTVVLTVVRPVRITHLVVCLHGFVKVFKNTVPPGEMAPDLGFLGPGRGRRGPEYLGNGLSTLFEDEVVLCGDGRLKEGIYKFRFEMCFPPYALPSSINVRLTALLLVYVLMASWIVRTRHNIIFAYIHLNPTNDDQPDHDLPTTRQRAGKHRYCPVPPAQAARRHTRADHPTVQVQSQGQVSRI